MKNQIEVLEGLSDRLVHLCDKLITSIELKPTDDLTATDSQIFERLAKVTGILISRYENKKQLTGLESKTAAELEAFLDD